MSRLLVIFPLAIALLAGCPPIMGGGEPLTQVPALTVHQGCGDISMFAVSDARDVQIRFLAEGLVEAAYAGTTDASWDATDPEIALTLEQGRNLDQGNCTDYVEVVDGVPVVEIEETWAVVSGTVTLTIDPTSDTYSVCNGPADAVLHLDQVVFESASGERLQVESLDVAANVGWCAG